MSIEEFNQYTKDMEPLFVKEYQWFYMPASVHKIEPSGDILPIG